MTAEGSVEPTVLGAGWRHRQVVGAWILLAVVVCSGFVVLQPTRYKGTASILLQQGLAAGVNSSITPDRFVADEVAQLRSPVVADRARLILSQGDSAVRPQRRASIGAISVSSSTTNSEVKLSVSAATTGTADAELQALLDAYVQVQKENLQQAIASASKQIDAAIAGVDAQLAKLNSAPTATANGDPRLAAQIAQLDAEHALLQQQRDQIGVSNSLSAGHFIVSSQPHASRQSIRGTAIKLELLAVVFGVLFGLGHAYLLSRRRRRFDSKMQPATVLRGPLLFEVPEYKAKSGGKHIVVGDAPESRAAEAFAFAAQMHFGAGYSGLADGTVIAVTSAESGIGTTTVVANLGLALAQSGLEVLMIDGAIASGSEHRSRHSRPSLTELFHGSRRDILGLEDVTETGASLSDATATVRDLRLVLLGSGRRHARSEAAVPIAEMETASVSGAHRLGHPGVSSFRPSAPPLVNPAEQVPAVVRSGLDPSGIQRMILEARDFFDVVLIDTPPVLSIGARGVLLQAADQVVLVVTHGEETNPVQDASSRIHVLGATELGYVYNRAPIRGRAASTEGLSLTG